MDHSSNPLRATSLRLIGPAIAVVITSAGCSGDAPRKTLPPAAEPDTQQSESQPWHVIPASDRKKFLTAMTEIDPRLANHDEHTLT